MSMIFSEKNLIDGNLFKFENRLKSHVSKYNEGGELLTTYFSQDENSSTVDRGTQDIDKLFGKNSPIIYNRIMNFPLNQFTPTTPENSEEQQIEDIGVEGDAVIFPGTIVPKQYDFFIVNHLKMVALFEVTSVQYDMMKVEGYYKIHYRLQSNSKETIDKLVSQVKYTYHTDLNAIGSNRNPIIREDDFILRQKIESMVSQMISSYRSLFYNKRHNCFLYFDPSSRMTFFDICGNEFMAKYALANYYNSSDVIVLNSKVRDNNLPYKYNNSVYNWIENGCATRFLQKFHYSYDCADNYPESSFHLWGEGDIQIISPLSTRDNIPNNSGSMFDDIQLSSFLDTSNEPTSSEFDLLIWRFINKKDSLSIHDVPLYIGDALMSSIKHRDVFFYTPMAVYMIRHILELN